VVVAESGADYLKLVNADVRLTGITEETVNSRGDRLASETRNCEIAR
jgi:hypothetical protein